jgi:hypothetical protein
VNATVIVNGGTARSGRVSGETGLLALRELYRAFTCTLEFVHRLMGFYPGGLSTCKSSDKWAHSRQSSITGYTEATSVVVGDRSSRGRVWIFGIGLSGQGAATAVTGGSDFHFCIVWPINIAFKRALVEMQ